MKLHAKKMAHAVAAVTALCQLIYTAVAYIFPNLIYTYVGSMAPGYDFSMMANGGENLLFHLLGVVLISISAWVFVYVAVWLYNREVE